MTIKSLDLKIAATHINFINKNFLYYTDNAVVKKGGYKSWTEPFRKPQLVSHDTKASPIGRIIDQAIEKDPLNPDSYGYVLITVRITDEDAIQKILDGRYNTCSVGTTSNKVMCSECGRILNREGLCKHKKGSLNEDGEPIYWKVDQLEYTEDSFVNEPADAYSRIISIKINNNWISYSDYIKSIDDGDFQLEDSMSTEVTNTTVENNDAQPVVKEVKDMVESELRDHIVTLLKTIEDGKIATAKIVDEHAVAITGLQNDIKQKDELLIQKDNDINKYLAEVTKLEKNYKDSIIFNIMDLQKADTTNKDELVQRYTKRETVSLVDTLNDLRTNFNGISSTDRVADPGSTTQTTEPTPVENKKNSFLYKDRGFRIGSKLNDK